MSPLLDEDAFIQYDDLRGTLNGFCAPLPDFVQESCRGRLFGL